MKRERQTKIAGKALVTLSGGQDSITCLGYALHVFDQVEAISFRYGQRHAIELECAVYMAEKFKVPHRIVDIGTMLSSLVTSALTGAGDTSAPHPTKTNLPASFVPGRNALFLTLAHAYAQTIGARAIVGGMCQTDYSGYPDCRERFINNLSHALNEGYQTPDLVILTPLMHLTKAQTFALAHEIGWLNEVVENSHTCYEGDHKTRHEWGYGCGKCPSCQLREKGFREFAANLSAGTLEKLFSF